MHQQRIVRILGNNNLVRKKVWAFTQKPEVFNFFRAPKILVKKGWSLGLDT